MRISDWSSDVCSSDLVRNECHRYRRLSKERSKLDTTKLAAGFLPKPVPSRPAWGIIIAYAGGDPFGGDDVRPLSAVASECRRSRSDERREGKECVRTCRSRW